MQNLGVVIYAQAWSLVVLALLAFAGVCVLVLTARWHGRFSMDHAHGIQKFHVAPTPRIGGVPIVLSLALWAWWLGPQWAQQGIESSMATQQEEALSLLQQILLGGSLAFGFGVLEDVTKRVGVMPRLLATMGSGVLAWWLSGVAANRLDIPFLDPLLAWVPLSVVFTAFAVGGVANALNIVDGFNGLASSVTIWASLGLAAIAAAVGDHALAMVCLFLAAATLGFFAMNWPFGKIFLGDGGSYFLGFGLAWCALLLIDRNPGVTAFAPLLVCAFPVIEVLFSAFRRKVRHMPAGQPDRLHLHSLVKQRYIRRWFSGAPVWWRNSVTGLLVGALGIPCAVLGYWLHPSPPLAALGFLGVVLVYVALYARVVRQRWCSPIGFLLTIPKASPRGSL
jgi:UDP-N-acetylmuramyl pentapeptide phosphotransferase/UDP-N-acetylglucosamine-1-phosphate transferase